MRLAVSPHLNKKTQLSFTKSQFSLPSIKMSVAGFYNLIPSLQNQSLFGEPRKILSRDTLSRL